MTLIYRFLLETAPAEAQKTGNNLLSLLYTFLPFVLIIGVMYFFTIRPQKKRSNKEWIKTVLVGADGGLVIALLRQPIYAGFHDRMAIAIPDLSTIDKLWEDRKSKNIPLKVDVMRMMNELSKLNTQRHVHFLDLYAAMNIIRRTPPQDLLSVLSTSDEITHVGDHYYHLTESE